VHHFGGFLQFGFICLFAEFLDAVVAALGAELRRAPTGDLQRRFDFLNGPARGAVVAALVGLRMAVVVAAAFPLLELPEGALAPVELLELESEFPQAARSPAASTAAMSAASGRVPSLVTRKIVFDRGA
jgi:hypothetical protein